MHSVDEYRRVSTACLLLIAFVLAGVGLHFLGPVIVPFLLAVTLHIILTPVVLFLKIRWKLPHLVASGVAFLIALLAVLLIAGLIGLSLGDTDDIANKYAAGATKLTQRISSIPWVQEMNIDVQSLQEKGLELLRSNGGDIARKLTSGIVGLVGSATIVLIFLLFIMLEDPIRKKLPQPDSLISEVTGSLKRYIGTKILLSAITGLLVGATLWILGVEFALVFGVLAFFLNFLPNIGSIAATLLPMPVVLLDPDLSATRMVLAFVIPGLIQVGIGNVLEPKMMGVSLDLHPITVLMGLIFFGTIWGIPGMFLATPMLAAARIILNRFEYTRLWANLLAGRIGNQADATGTSPVP